MRSDIYKAWEKHQIRGGVTGGIIGEWIRLFLLVV